VTRALPLLLALAGCASAPPGTARLDSVAELGEVRVVRIDGATIVAANVVHVPAGRHVLGVHCEFNEGIMIGDAQHMQRDLIAEIVPGARYHLRASMSPRPCSVALIDAGTGRVIATTD